MPSAFVEQFKNRNMSKQSFMHYYVQAQKEGELHEIVYRKCIKAGKLKWAIKIAYNYGLQDESKNDDTVMALVLALMSVSNCR